MKELVLQYNKLRSLNKVNNYSLFQSFYDEKNLIPMVEERNPLMACTKIYIYK